MRTLLVAALCCLGSSFSSAARSAPAITIPDSSGRIIDLASMQSKVVLLSFWASWASESEQHVDWLEELHRRYASRGLVVLGIGVDHDAQRFASFLHASPATFRMAHDSAHTVVDRYAPPRIPFLYVIKNGGIRAEYEARAHHSRVEQQIEVLLH